MSHGHWWDYIKTFGFEMSKICCFEMKGVVVWFRIIKLVYNLNLKIFGHCFAIVAQINVVTHTTV